MNLTKPLFALAKLLHICKVSRQRWPIIVNAGWQIERLEPVCVGGVWWWCGERERGALTLVNQSHPHQLVHQEANEEGQHEEWQQDHLGTEAPSVSRGEITWATG